MSKTAAISHLSNYDLVFITKSQKGCSLGCLDSSSMQLSCKYFIVEKSIQVRCNAEDATVACGIETHVGLEAVWGNQDAICIVAELEEKKALIIGSDNRQGI